MNVVSDDLFDELDLRVKRPERPIPVANLLMRGLDPRSVRKLESELEKENRELREKVAALESKLATLMELWKLRG